MKTTLDVIVSRTFQDITVFAPGPQGIQGAQGIQGVQGVQGIQGIQGVKGDVSSNHPAWATVIAGETLSGHRVVRVQNGRAYLTTCQAREYAGQATGVTVSAALLGEAIQVQFAGTVVEVSWAFAPGRVYLSQIGTLTNTVPTAGFIQQIGRVIDPTTIHINITNPILLEH